MTEFYFASEETPMHIRRFVLLALLGLGIAAAQLAPVFTVASARTNGQTLLADGDEPIPEECGLMDICKVDANS